MQGKVININKKLFNVEVNNEIIECEVRGKIKEEICVGDNVLIDKNNKTIEKLLPRQNKLDRPNVSNIDYALIITSLKKPDLDLILLDKLISIITINKIKPIIILTKKDLLSSKEIKEIKRVFNYYKSIGINVYYNNQIIRIKRLLKGKIVTLCGQTGAGKSSLINKLDKHLNLETKEISNSLNRGVHTTRLTTLYKINNFYIIDTPGFSSIDISEYSKEEIRDAFIEFNNSNCKFKDCMHINEKGCSINKNNILKTRYDNYINFIRR